MTNNESNKVNHTIEPVFYKNSKILILGTMPSVKSREAKFFYMHPQNIFWKVISDILHQPFPDTIEEKKSFLLNNRIAVWDVLKSCEIEGSSDSSIKNPVLNDFSKIIANSEIEAIFTTGSKATNLFKRYCSKTIGMDSIYLPSTSPANRKYYSHERICDEWRKILQYLH